MDHQTGFLIPEVRILRNERSGDFLIWRAGAIEGRGGSVPVGDLQPLLKDELNERGLELVLHALKTYQVWPPTSAESKCEVTNMTSKERSNLVNRHRFVVCMLRDQNAIHVCPEHREGRGLAGIVSRIDEEITVGLPSTNRDFAEALEKCFELAT